MLKYVLVRSAVFFSGCHALQCVQVSSLVFSFVVCVPGVTTLHSGCFQSVHMRFIAFTMLVTVFSVLSSVFKCVCASKIASLLFRVRFHAFMLFSYILAFSYVHSAFPCILVRSSQFLRLFIITVISLITRGLVFSNHF